MTEWSHASPAHKPLANSPIHRFRRYPRCVATGLDWLGEAPAHWDVRRLKTVASLAFSSVDKHSEEGELPVRLCNYTDVYYRERITADLEFMVATASRNEVRRFGLRSGDVLVTKDSESWEDIAVPAYVPTDVKGVLCGYHLAQIRPNSAILEGAYLFRAFQSRGINDQFRVASTGITRYGFSKSALGEGVFLLAPKPEQRAIAAFLDRETAKIDLLIAKKERLIELLEEERTTLITRAVTKGFDPSVPMKDSGIQWLAHIPSHWEVRRLKHASRKLTVGIVVTPSKYYEDSGIPCLRSLNISDGAVSMADMVYLSGKSNELHRKSKLSSGDVVVVRTGLAGTAAIIPPELDGANCIDLLIIRPSPRIGSRFLWYFINSGAAAGQVKAYSEGAIQAHYNTSTLGDLRISIPPPTEQARLVEFLDSEIGKIHLLGAKIREAVTKLREYRTALISASVTGKIDVRGEVSAA